jgi:ComF family protein
MIGAKIERERKRPEHERDAFGDLARDMGEKRFMRGDLMGKAPAARPQQFSVEEEALVGHRKALCRGASGPIMAAMPTGEAELGLERRGEAAAIAAERSGTAASMLRLIADFLMPPVCISCRTRVGSHGLLCGTCFAKIDFIAPPLCERLGVPVPFETGEKPLSAAATAAPPVYDRARAAAHYSDAMRELVQNFKYRDRHEGLALLARWLAKAGAELLADADLIIPVPLHATRLWRRRFNQSAMLAVALGRLCRVPRRLLRADAGAADGEPSGAHRRPAPPQCRRAFRVDKDNAPRIKGRKLVFVDDVITTGATAEACARVVKRAGAARVDVVVLARVVEPAAFVL